MKYITFRSGITVFFFLIFISCSQKIHISDQQNIEGEEQSENIVPEPLSVIIYKTKKDYYDKVPVTLSEDKSKIISFPSPKDLVFNGEFTLPIKLHGEFLLDRKGINANTAFLDISYEAYTKSMRVYSVQQLYDMIIEKNPFVEIYDCGFQSDFKHIVKELNLIIDEGKLEKFKTLKK